MFSARLTGRILSRAVRACGGPESQRDVPFFPGRLRRPLSIDAGRPWRRKPFPEVPVGKAARIAEERGSRKGPKQPVRGRRFRAPQPAEDRFGEMSAEEMMRIARIDRYPKALPRQPPLEFTLQEIYRHPRSGGWRPMVRPAEKSSRFTDPDRGRHHPVFALIRKKIRSYAKKRNRQIDAR